MAFGLSQTHLPFINQSISRQLRSGAFRSKTQVGPQTAQAITRGALEADRESALTQAAQSSQLKQQREIANQQAELARTGLAQEQEQFAANIASAEKLQAERLSQQQSQFESEQAAGAAAQYDAQRAAEDAQPGFWEGAFGS